MFARYRQPAAQETAIAVAPPPEPEVQRVKYNLQTAAIELGVSYPTTRHLFMADGQCERYSCGDVEQAVFGNEKSKRKATRTRLTWNIYPEDIERVRRRLRGLT